MVAAAYGYEIGLAVVAATRYGSLNSHLHSHFHGHAAAIGIEYIVHTLGRYLQEHLTQRDSRVVRQSAEHYMTHTRQLFDGGGIYHRVVVTVDDAPPRGHSVHQFGTVRQGDDASVGVVHLIGRQRVYRRCIRMP